MVVMTIPWRHLLSGGEERDEENPSIIEWRTSTTLCHNPFVQWWWWWRWQSLSSELLGNTKGPTCAATFMAVSPQLKTAKPLKHLHRSIFNIFPPSPSNVRSLLSFFLVRACIGIGFGVPVEMQYSAYCLILPPGLDRLCRLGLFPNFVAIDFDPAVLFH